MNINETISKELDIGLWQVEAVVKLIDEGNTIPFIARYRKEMHGSLNDEQLRKLDERLTYLRSLEDRKATVLSSIEEQGKLTEALKTQIEAALKMHGRRFTPLTVDLPRGVSVITGANMGGKSVCLKTLALNVYLTHCGLFPFADAATVPLFDGLCLVRGEGEDGREGLSSFGGELMAADAAARAVRDGFCLVLFDEFARGTNPAEAVKLQQGALSYFNASGSICLFVTHYEAVAARASRRFLTRGIRDLDVSEGRRRIEGGADKLAVLRRFMDYGIEEITTTAVPQKALSVAELLGVEDGLLQAIRQEYMTRPD